MITNLFIATLLLLSYCVLARGPLKISNYTGAGITNELENQILSAIINAYKIYKDTNFPAQT